MTEQNRVGRVRPFRLEGGPYGVYLQAIISLHFKAFAPVKRLFLIAMVLACLGASAAQAQTIRLDGTPRPLEAALADFRAQTGFDFVFARRLVAGKTVGCQYVGEEAMAALACLLDGTGLRAQIVRPGQYVLVEVKATRAEPVRPARVPRGTVAGFIFDAETGEPLPGAHVLLAERKVGTTTNEAGYFALPSRRATPQPIRISYLGYRMLDTTLTAARPSAPAARIALRPALLVPGAVVVEAMREGDEARFGPSAPSSLSMREIEVLPAALGGADLFQALEWIPGVQRAGEVTGGLLVRGGGPDQNLYLIDGAPIYHPWHAFSLVSTFQTDTFKDVRLYRDGFPAEHGGRLSAVLDAELKDGGQTTPRFVTALTALSARFLIESPITASSSFMISGRRSYLDKLIGPTHPVEDERGRRDTLRTDYHFYDVSAKLTFRPSARTRLALSYYDGRDRLDLRLPFDLSLDFSSWLRPADLFFEVDQDWGNTLYSVRFQYLHSRELFVTVTGYDSGYQATERAFIQPTSTASVATSYQVRLRELGLKVDVDFYPSLRHQVRAGLVVSDHRFFSELDASVARAAGAVETLEDTSQPRTAEAVAYIQEVWRPSGRWRVEPGLRLSYFGRGDYLRLNPRLSARYVAWPDRVVVHAGASVQVQYLHRLRDRFSFLYDLVSSRWVPSGETVRPSRGAQVSAGLEGRALPGLTLSVDGYWRGARNVLLPRDPFQTKDGLLGPGIEVGTLLGEYTPGEEQAFGTELAAIAERGPWRLRLAYAGGRSRSRAPELGETTFHPARFDVPRSFRSVLQRTGEQWSLTLATQWRSGYPLTVPVARYALGDPLDPTPTGYLYRPELNNGRLPPYFRLDATLAYRFEWVGAQWRARIHLYNLLSRRNIIGRVYDPAGAQVRVINRRGLPLLPLFEFVMEL